jgi:two-component system response regulator HydG
MKNTKIIIVEDNDTMRLGMQESLQREGYTVQSFSDPETAFSQLKNEKAQFVITDLRMEPFDGFELLKRIKADFPHIEVMIATAYGSVQSAVQAMQAGALDFITKPFSPDELRIRVQKALEKIENKNRLGRLEEQNIFLQQELAHGYNEIIGQSKPMQEVFSLVERVARQDSAVLIYGESGTGKELTARAIHRSSQRKDQPFIKVNCAALNDNLLESELFGHEKGAFTGALRQRKGRFELADSGTIFLDEIGDISPAMQVRLLHVLQEKEFERVGGERTLQVDVRVITATNRSLMELISEGKFREDLFYRLNVIPINLPALRQRKDDIPLLAVHFLQKINSRRYFSGEAMTALQTYSWPGNIRELENIVERLQVISTDDEINPANLAACLGEVPGNFSSFSGLSLDDALYNFEKNLIKKALEEANGVKNRAAKLLGVRTSALYYKLEKFGLLK